MDVAFYQTQHEVYMGAISTTNAFPLLFGERLVYFIYSRERS